MGLIVEQVSDLFAELQRVSDIDGALAVTAGRGDDAKPSDRRAK
jgi:hypothetical protein